MLVSFQCSRRPKTHQYVLVEIAVGASRQASLGMVSVPCPNCGKKTHPEVVG